MYMYVCMHVYVNVENNKILKQKANPQKIYTWKQLWTGTSTTNHQHDTTSWTFIILSLSYHEKRRQTGRVTWESRLTFTTSFCVIEFQQVVIIQRLEQSWMFDARRVLRVNLRFDLLLGLKTMPPSILCPFLLTWLGDTEEETIDHSKNTSRCRKWRQYRSWLIRF